MRQPCTTEHDELRLRRLRMRRKLIRRPRRRELVRIDIHAYPCCYLDSLLPYVGSVLSRTKWQCAGKESLRPFLGPHFIRVEEMRFPRVCDNGARGGNEDERVVDVLVVEGTFGVADCDGAVKALGSFASPYGGGARGSGFEMGGYGGKRREVVA